MKKNNKVKDTNNVNNSDELSKIISQEPEIKNSLSSDSEITNEDDEYGEYIMNLVEEVFSDIDAEKFSLEPALLGYDMNSKCQVYDYDLACDILMANGYCPECTDNFLDAMSYSSGDEDDERMMFIRRKEVAYAKCMTQKFMEEHKDGCATCKSDSFGKTSQEDSKKIAWKKSEKKRSK